MDGLPEFGSLIKIWYVSNTSVLIATKAMENMGFVEELKAVEISEPSLPEDLQVSRPTEACYWETH